MIKRGIATFSLDYGKCPRWLFERMVKLGRELIFIIRKEYSPDEFIRRISHPVWFQSLGTVLGFDWNSSGLTTTLTAALKEAIRGSEKELDIFICGGKGKTSRKTPNEIKAWGDVLGLPSQRLIYISKMSAKVDNCLLQDGFDIYHHSFFFSSNGVWAVVQQGMNIESKSARRYHWYCEKATDIVCEPHTGIISQISLPTLDLVAKESEQTRRLSTELVCSGYKGLMKDIEILRKHSSSLSWMISLKIDKKEVTFLRLKNKKFYSHPVLLEDFLNSRYLERVLFKVCCMKPKSYEELLSIEGVGPKTIRALSLVCELIYGAEPSYKDPARYSFAHGGKDGTPYYVDRTTYDATISFFSRVVEKMRLTSVEKKTILQKIYKSV